MSIVLETGDELVLMGGENKTTLVDSDAGGGIFTDNYLEFVVQGMLDIDHDVTFTVKVHGVGGTPFTAPLEYGEYYKVTIEKIV